MTIVVSLLIFFILLFAGLFRNGSALWSEYDKAGQHVFTAGENQTAGYVSLIGLFQTGFSGKWVKTGFSAKMGEGSNIYRLSFMLLKVWTCMEQSFSQLWNMIQRGCQQQNIYSKFFGSSLEHDRTK